MANLAELLGNGIIAPLQRRAGADFLSSSGVPLVRSALRQIVGTRKGELRWRPNFGLTIDRRRHQVNNDALAVLVKADIEAAVRQFEPRVDVVQVEVRSDKNTLIARVGWNVIDKNVPGNQVILGPDTFEVKI